METAHNNFVAPYAGVVKQPDSCLVPKRNGQHLAFPSVVVEVGGSSSAEELKRVRRIWQEGSGGEVRVVLLPKIYQPNVWNEVRVVLTIWRTQPGSPATTKVFVGFVAERNSHEFRQRSKIAYTARSGGFSSGPHPQYGRNFCWSSATWGQPPGDCSPLPCKATYDSARLYSASRVAAGPVIGNTGW